jgi:hypothetical protein
MEGRAENCVTWSRLYTHFVGTVEANIDQAQHPPRVPTSSGGASSERGKGGEPRIKIKLECLLLAIKVIDIGIPHPRLMFVYKLHLIYDATSLYPFFSLINSL